jgi:hypothetical protein
MKVGPTLQDRGHHYHRRRRHLHHPLRHPRRLHLHRPTRRHRGDRCEDSRHIGIDAEGVDLRRGGKIARLDFLAMPKARLGARRAHLDERGADDYSPLSENRGKASDLIGA